ncbi:11299_t:CDS:2 [Acaulospora morrowiae]|uniref:11299_t:CDS:1 n=1 Tax=Acaulospora morrowiae TaxID=94023 RepID=A0A9N9B2S1_9GLOM|nr:11299_t:CDS:2 [Acaulospora morrowiae]
MPQLVTAEIEAPPPIPTDDVGYLDEAYINSLSLRLQQNPNYRPASTQVAEDLPLPRETTQDDTETDVTELDEDDWEEILEQTKQIFVAFLLPILGRWLGRKFSFWGKASEFFKFPHGQDSLSGTINPVSLKKRKRTPQPKASQFNPNKDPENCCSIG